MSSSKRPSDAPAGTVSTPVKRSKTEGEGMGLATAGTGADVSSSPAVGHTDSPSARGNRGGRGGGRGGRGGDRGDRGGKRGRGDRRGGGRGGKDSDSRTWGGRSDNAKGGMRAWGKKEGEEGTEGGEKKERLPKKKVAVLIGYNGTAYLGSQINPGIPTIEDEVFKALVKAGAISEDNSNDHQKVGLARAARTDAGVHAAVNVISLKMILAPPGLPEGTSLEDFVNTFLPATVRVWKILRVQNGFNPRNLCDQRHYEYTLPTHVFLGPKPGSPMHLWLERSRAADKATAGTSTIPAPAPGATLQSETSPAPPPTETELATAAATEASEAFWAAQPSDSTFTANVQAKKGWRISPGLLESARTFVRAYEGSHNYYNFTSGKDFRDRSAQRTMRNLTITEPFLVNSVEYVSVNFIGQSFMLHQIRKMIGLTILAVRTSTPASLIAETFGPSRIHIPKAPGLGLCLLEPQYIEYNNRLDESNIKIDALVASGAKIDADNNVKRDAVAIGDKIGVVDDFKMKEIYDKMRALEDKDLVFSKWLNYLDVFLGSDFEYLNAKGVIPASAVFKKGENPEKPRRATKAEGEAATTAEDEVAPPSDDEAGVGEEEG